MCTRKNCLEMIIEKKPELEELILRQLEAGAGGLRGSATMCYVCDGHNYNCPDYHEYKPWRQEENE